MWRQIQTNRIAWTKQTRGFHEDVVLSLDEGNQRGCKTYSKIICSNSANLTQKEWACSESKFREQVNAY